MPVSHLQLSKPLLSQIIAIIQRDQAATIAAVNSSLDIITEFHKGPRYRTAFPWLTLGWRETTFNEDSEQSQEQHAVIDLVLEAGQFDTELAQDMAMDYLIVLDAILRNAGPPPSYADWTTALPIVHETVVTDPPLTVPLPAGSIKGIFIQRESLELVHRQEIDQPIMAVTIEIAFALEEYMASGA